MNEAQTRAEYIDPALKAAGWGVVEGSRILREYSITLGRIEGHGRRGKSLTADYVLEYRNTKLAVVEAKAYDAQNKLLKEFYPKDIKKVNGQWQVGSMKIDNVQTGSRTTLEFDLKAK